MRRTIQLMGTALLMACATEALALGTHVADCTGPNAGLRLLDRHPELSEACVAVIQIDGRRYLQLGARLQQRHDEVLVLRLNRSSRDLALSPASQDPTPAVARELSRQLPIGSPLSLYVPDDRVLEVFADATTLADVEVPVVVESTGPAESRFGNYTCCPRRRPWYPIVDVLPLTAGPLPVMGLVGAALLVIAAALRGRHLRRH
jgi:hypothetical protein